MSYLDQVFKKNITEIMNEGVSTHGSKVRAKWADGTPAHTTKTSNIVSVYDLRKEIPIMTLRKVPYKNAIDEILWIWQKKSNDIYDLKSRIWDAWGKETTKKSLIKVAPIIKDYVEKSYEPVKVADLIDTTKELRSSNRSGDFYVLEKNGTKRTIQFKDTGYIKITNQSQVSAGDVIDPYTRTVCGIGYYGLYDSEDIKSFFGEAFKSWVTKWENMVRRCNGQYNAGNWYNHVFLSEEFECCETFLRWAMENIRYKDKSIYSKLQIDKDYYGSNCYGPDTCTILTPKENTSLTLNKWYVYDNEPFFSASDLANCLSEKLNLKLHKPNGQYNDDKLNKLIAPMIEEGLIQVINPNLLDENGMLARFDLKVKLDLGRAYGYQLAQKAKYPEGEFDQVDRLLWCLKNDPQDRRMIADMFNHQDLHAMGLAPCCHHVNLTVVGDRLDMLLKQRSQDMAVANGWNVFQYAILLHMFAIHAGLEAGKLTHVITDCHIYDRHMDGVLELMARPELPAPRLVIKEKKDFYDWTVDDFELVDYQHGDPIKFEVAI